jgi:hypothetical protein
MHPRHLSLELVPAQLAGVEGVEDYWFDVVADTGDSDVGAYSLGYLLHGDLTIADRQLVDPDEPEPQLPLRVLIPADDDAVALPRGQFLLVGGDTAYPVADAALIRQRFTQPLNWALEQRFPGARPPARPLLGIPGNHDWYDNLDGFNRTFRRLPRAEPEKLESTTEPTTPESYVALQEASYFSLQLPGGWALWALDARDGSDVDYRQRCYFAGLDLPTKLLLATPNPAFVNGAPAPWLAEFWERMPAGARAQLRLWYSGDTHHYARYDTLALGAGPPFTSLVSGLGGAALHAPSRGEVPAAKLYPQVEQAERAVIRRLLNPVFMTQRWGLSAFGAVLGLLLGVGALEREGEVASLIALVAPGREPRAGSWPLLMLTMLAIFSVAGGWIWQQSRRRKAREHEVRTISHARRALTFLSPVLVLLSAMVVLARWRDASFGNVVSEVAFELVLLFLLVAVPALFVAGVDEGRRSFVRFAALLAVGLTLGAVTVVGSVAVARLAMRVLGEGVRTLPGLLAPPLAAALLQALTFSLMAGVALALGFKLGAQRMMVSSFAAIDEHLAFIRFRLRVNKTTNQSALTGFVIRVAQAVPREALNRDGAAAGELVPRAELIDVFTVK